MKYKDYYAALGVPRDADTDQIKKAYRKLARELHPDVSKAADAEERFKEVGEAYGTLKDPEKRKAYDALGSRPSNEDFTPPPQWQRAYSQAGDASGDAAFEEMDLSDLFAAFGRGGFGGGAAGGQRGPIPMAGRDYDSTIEISLEDAHRGATMNLQLADEGGGRTLEVTIPPGVREGQKLRLRGKGGKGRNGGPDGDIYLHITLAPHAVFRADKHDLYFDLALAPWEAALGAEVEVQTLDGSVVLTVPAGTRAGRKLRLRGRGLAQGSAQGAARGDLYAIAHIDVPAKLSPRERELFEELSRVSDFKPRVAAH
jgi:curved DNA-binding protein